MLELLRGKTWISLEYGPSCKSPYLDWMVHPRFVGYKSALVTARLAFKVFKAGG